MLTRQENELLCHVENGAPMGEVIARYWLPALDASLLVADGAPKRIELLGRTFVGFRDSEGKVGVLDEHCPHRGVSLVLARNENCALQCLYHGWRFALDGRIIETPNEPDSSVMKDRFRQPAYPAREVAGVIWVYIGPGDPPPFPDFQFADLPVDQVFLMKAKSNCNWVQMLEGVIDSAHIMFLHADMVFPSWNGRRPSDMEDFVPGGLSSKASQDTRPSLLLEQTDYGFQYGAVRSSSDGGQYVRTTHFVAPFYGFPPPPEGWGIAQAFVPINDVETFFFYWTWRTDGQSIDPAYVTLAAQQAGLEVGVDIDEDGNHVNTYANNWNQDREAMIRKDSFSGIKGVNTEDLAVMESMRPIYDRTKEHLCKTDIAVVTMRRQLMDAAKALSRGAEPIGVRCGDKLHSLRGAEGVISKAEPWQAVGAWKRTVGA